MPVASAGGEPLTLRHQHSSAVLGCSTTPPVPHDTVPDRDRHDARILENWLQQVLAVCYPDEKSVFGENVQDCRKTFKLSSRAQMPTERRCSKRKKLTASQQRQSWNSCSRVPIRCSQHSNISQASHDKRRLAQLMSRVRHSSEMDRLCLETHTKERPEPDSEVICDSPTA